MLTLYFLRHAEALTTLTTKDIDRPLSEHGMIQASTVGRHLPQQIDKVLCSDAKRTRTTLRQIESVARIEICNRSILSALYNAKTQTLLDTIRAECDTERTVLIIGHNPGIYELANQLCIFDNSAPRLQLLEQYKPGTLSVIECPIKSWKELQPNINKLVRLTRA